MSETKRVALTTLNTDKCDNKSVKNCGKSVRLNISIFEPNEDSCSVFNYSTLLNAAEKKRLKKKHPDGKVNGAVDPFDDDHDDEDVKRIAQQFEEKYGSGDKSKHNRCQTYAELGAGYDENDSFIDNTDAFDGALPEDLQTVHGGYYVNSGPLELRRVECDDLSDFDEIKGKKRKFGVNVIRDSESEEDEDDDDDDDDDDEDDDEDDEEEEEEEVEEEVNGKETSDQEKEKDKVAAATATPVEEKMEIDEKEKEVISSNVTVVKKMKLSEKTEEKVDTSINNVTLPQSVSAAAVVPTESSTTAVPTVLNNEECPPVKKKRKKRTLTMAERQQLIENEQLLSQQQQEIVNNSGNISVSVPSIPLQTAHSNNSLTITNVSNPLTDNTNVVTKHNNNAAGGNNYGNNNQSLTNSPPNNSLTISQQQNNSISKQNKKKALTVKALLEEKRGFGNEQITAGSTSPACGNISISITTTIISTGTTNTTTIASSNTSSNNSPTSSKTGSVICAEPVDSKKDSDNNRTSVNDVIEYVISSARDGESSKDSSSSASKSQSGPLLVCTDSDLSTESSDSQVNKSQQVLNASSANKSKDSSANEIPPLPDNLPADFLDLINNIKASISQSSDMSRRGFSGDVNNLLLSFEKRSSSLPVNYRNVVYDHLACFFPCSKFTLMKRAKKLYFDSVEEKMSEPLKKLKIAIDSIMPSLLEKYSKECQKIASEKSADEPPSRDASGEGAAKNESVSPKIPRRKFIWNNDMRMYVHELIELRNQCYLIKNPRRESRDAYISSFLTSKVQALWPPGWMKSSNLLREAGEVQAINRSKKKTSQQQSPTQLQQLIQGHTPQQPTHSQRQCFPPQKSQQIQSLVNVSLPSSTTLTPANISSLNYNSKASMHQDPRNQSKRTPVTITSALPHQISVASPSVISSHNIARMSPDPLGSNVRTPTPLPSKQPQKPRNPPKKQNSIESSQNHKNQPEQFPLYNLIKNQSNEPSLAINETKVEQQLYSNNLNTSSNNSAISVSHKSSTNKKLDDSISKSSNNSRSKESNTNLKHEYHRNSLQPAVTSDLSSSSKNSNSNGINNHKNNNKNGKDFNNSNKNHGNNRPPLISMSSESEINKIIKSTTITLNGSSLLTNNSKEFNNPSLTVSNKTGMLSASTTSSPLTLKIKREREIKTEPDNDCGKSNNSGVINSNNKVNSMNVDNILDLSNTSSSCGVSNSNPNRTDNNNCNNMNNSNSVSSKGVIKNISASVNERTKVFPSDPRTSTPSSSSSSSATVISSSSPNIKDQKSSSNRSSSPSSSNNNTNCSNMITPTSHKKSPQTTVTTPVRSLKQRILQDQQLAASQNVEIGDGDCSVVKNSTVNSNNNFDKKIKTESTSTVQPISGTMPNSGSKLPEVKTEVKTEVKSEHIQTTTIDFDHQMNLETVTATDILSQLINESLLGHHEEVVVHTSPMETNVNQPKISDDSDHMITGKDRERRHSTGSRQNRVPSGDQEAKMQMEVDQVIQDLAMLRQMSGGSKSNPANTEETSPHKTIVNVRKIKSRNVSGHKRLSSGSFYSSSSSCSSVSSLVANNEMKKSTNQSVSSYQNEFYKHLMQKDSVSPPPIPLSPPTSATVFNSQDASNTRHQNFQNSSFPSEHLHENIPIKYPKIVLHPLPGQAKHSSSSKSQSSQQHASSNCNQQLSKTSPGVIQHHSSSFHSPSYNRPHHHHQPQSVLPTCQSKNEEFPSVISSTNKSSQLFNQFDHWSLTGNSRQSSPE